MAVLLLILVARVVTLSKADIFTQNSGLPYLLMRNRQTVGGVTVRTVTVQRRVTKTAFVTQLRLGSQII